MVDINIIHISRYNSHLLENGPPMNRNFIFNLHLNYNESTQIIEIPSFSLLNKTTSHKSRERLS